MSITTQSLDSCSTNKHSEDNEINLQCGQCGWSLCLANLDETKRMLVCSNKNCMFPLDSDNMKAFIFESGDIKDFFKKVNSIINKYNPENNIETEENNEYNDKIFQEEEDGMHFFND